MKKEKKDRDFIKSAYYEGGKAALEAYVKKELRYPKEALAAKVEGTVSMRYTVDYKGNVTEAGIISGLGHGCDDEALRLVRGLKFKVPEDGKIKSKYSRKLHIHFRLPGSPAVLPATKKLSQQTTNSFQVHYQITPTVKPANAPKSTQGTSYQIQINLPSKNKNS